MFNTVDVIGEYQDFVHRGTMVNKGHELGLVGMGISGEAGEVTDLIKKHLYHNKELDDDRLIEELGDVLWYIALAANLLGIGLEDIMASNMRKLKERYPERHNVNMETI